MKGYVFIMIIFLCMVGGCLNQPEPEFSADDFAYQPVVRADVDCSKIAVEEDKKSCFIIEAIYKNDSSICESFEDVDWKIFCLRQLGEDEMADSYTTTTTSTVSTTSTTGIFWTTTTTIKCGNGVIDWGEDCDIGSLCEHADGVCNIRPDLGLATCLVNKTCVWSIRYPLSGVDYDLGKCNGCYGKDHERACKCFGVINELITTTTLEPHHLKCSSTECIKVLGEGVDECQLNSDCFHWECKGKSCVLTAGAKEDSCESDFECMSIWDA